MPIIEVTHREDVVKNICAINDVTLAPAVKKIKKIRRGRNIIDEENIKVEKVASVQDELDWQVRV